MECAEYAAHAIRRALYVKKDRKPQWPSLRLSGFGRAVSRIFPQQNTRITFRLKTPQTHFRSSVLSTGRAENWRLALLKSVALDCGTQNEDIFWFVLVFCEHQPLRNHRITWLFASPKRKYFGPCQPASLYCELGATSMEFRCWWKRSVSVLFKHTLKSSIYLLYPRGVPFPLCWRWLDLRHCADSALTGDPIVKPNTCW